MKFGIFYEHQLPRPWSEGVEQKLFSDALEQVEVADQLGIDFAWEVEHHFLEEYSHSSAPEVFLAAASQRTKNIRLGHGIIQATTNHPARVAEKVATLDLVRRAAIGQAVVVLAGILKKETQQRLARLQGDPNSSEQEIKQTEEDLKTLDYLYENFNIGMNVFRTAKGGRAKLRE